MAQTGREKQNPPDQRARGMNPEHPEGQANAANRAKQTEQDAARGKPGTGEPAGG